MKSKFYLIFFILFFTLTFMSCKKDKKADTIDPMPKIDGSAQSLYNGLLWDFDVSIWENPDLQNRYNLFFTHKNEYGEERGEFIVRNIVLKNVATYALKPWEFNVNNIDTTMQYCMFFPLYSDGDVVGDVYVPLNDSSMVLTVDQVNSGNQISGRFWGKMLKKIEIDEVELDPASPDTIEFSEGTYEVKLE